METGKNTPVDRNRKQTGKSEEIVAESAICTCDKGSKPGTFRVASQQKVYCNGARKLVATDQDKDIKSLNFGSCAAKNNGPCSPSIVWSNTYNKVAIKGKMYPLTVKSSGTCMAGGGRINIQTSGQQVVVKPSSSPRKANSTAHKSPVFTEEDWKRLPQSDEGKAQNKRVPAAVQVNNVLVNGKREITITPYDQEELLFTTSLTAGSMRGTGVKWDVCHGNRVITKGLTEAPARTYFTKEGTYFVYAYVHKPGSPKGKGVVRITVSYPKFKSLEWKDENGKTVTYIGLRNKVFAHVSLPGCKGITVNCRFYYNGYEGKTYLSALTPMILSAAGKVKIALSLSGNQLKKIREDRKRFSDGETVRIYLELSSRHWIENLTKASKYPILFNDRIEFRSLVIYKDSDCKEKLQGGIADSGSTVYVRVSTTNMETGKIRLDVYKHETGTQEEKSPKPTLVYSNNSPVNSTGIYKFSLSLAAPPCEEGVAYKAVVSWTKNSHSSNVNKQSINAIKKLGKGKFAILLIRRKVFKQIEKKSIITKQETVLPVNTDCVCKQYDLIYGRKVSCAFRKKVVEICSELWGENCKIQMANKLMAVMEWESGGTFSPGVPNIAKSKGTGLIQFMPDTARRLLGIGIYGTGSNKKKDITIEYTDKYFGQSLPRIREFAHMTALEQLDYVKKYFEPLRGKKVEFIDFYLQVLFPASSMKSEHIVFAKSMKLLTSTNEKDTLKKLRVIAYEQNRGLDSNKDGVIWKSEIDKKVQIYMTKGLAYKENKFVCDKTPTSAKTPTSKSVHPIVSLIRKWEYYSGENATSSTIGEFYVSDDPSIHGFIAEPYGPSSIQSGQDKRIPVGEYNLRWYISSTYGKNKYKKKNIILKNGFPNVYNENVSAQRGILIHIGNFGKDTVGCLLPGNGLMKRTINGKEVIVGVSDSAGAFVKLIDYLESKGIENVKLVISENYEKIDK